MLPVVFLILSTSLLGLLLISISYFFAPKGKKSSVKKEAYECGIPAKKQANTQISVKFFLTAILFILFDIEIIFLYPFAIAYRDFLQMEESLPILFGMGLFLIFFIYGLWWEIKTKALNWK